MAYSLLSLLLLSLSLLSSSAEQDAAAKGRSKAESLRYLASMQDGLIHLNATGYEYYVLDYPRPYTLVVIFNADPKKYKCGPCEEIQHIMHQVIYSYKESAGELPYTSPEGIKSRAVFFAEIDYKPENQALFKRHGFASVPNLLVTHPKSISLEGENYHFKREDAWEFHTGSEILPHKVLEFINNRASRNVELKTPPLQAFLAMFYTIVLLTLLVGVLYKLKKYILNPYVWFMGSLVYSNQFIYFLCASGVVYDIIHKSPLAGYNSKTGVTEYIHSGQRSQYAGEGFMMGFLMCLGGICLIALINSSKLESPNRMRIMGYIALVLVVFAIYKLIGVYSMKSAWYKPSFFPPSYYIRGPLMRDQGSSF